MHPFASASVPTAAPAAAPIARSSAPQRADQVMRLDRTVLADAGDPDPKTLCANLARCVIEVLAGARSLDQLGRWVSDSVYIHLLRRTVLAARARAESTDDSLRPRMRIGDPKLSAPSEGVVEAVVLVHQPGRSRAVAIRLEQHRARWRATAINVL